MTGFCIQEFILSGIYVREALRILKGSLADNTRKFMVQLLTINVLIMVMDCGLVGLEYANLYILQVALKGVVYAIKLKLEYAVLSRLVSFVKAPNRGSVTLDGNPFTTAAEKADRSPSLRCSPRSKSNAGVDPLCTGFEVYDFVDPSKPAVDMTNAHSFAAPEMFIDRRVSELDREMARMATGQSPLSSTERVGRLPPQG